jgi:CBS domain-containing protein
MTRYAVAVRPGASFQDMAARLSRFRVSAFPVVDDDGTVIGVVSETDMLTRRALDLARETLAGEHAGGEPGEPDGLTAGDLMTRPDPSPFTVTVRSGVVTLQGSPETATLGRGILHKIRHVPGVVAVRDRLSYPPDQAVGG